MEFTAETQQVRRYWRFEPGAEEARADAHVEFRALLEDAVRIRMRSDVPVGVCLSGGLDSSSVARLASRNTGRPIDCFSLRYPGSALDESHYARLAADDASRYRLHWIEPDADDFMDTVARIVWHHDAPMPIRGRYPQWYVLKGAAGHVTVSLDGQGADELLGGYGRFILPFAIDSIALRDRGLAAAFRDLGRELHALTGMGQNRPAFLARLLASVLKQHLTDDTWPWQSLLDREFRRRHAPVQEWHQFHAWLANSAAQPYASRVNNALWNEFTLAGLPELLHAEDALSMAFSLESRLPFLDHRLVEYCFTLPYDDKLGAGWTKILLRRASEDLLPEAIRWRRKKLGFPGLDRQWLAGDPGLGSIRDVLLEPRCLARGVLHRPKIERQLGGSPERARTFVGRNLERVWKLITTELWFRQFIDNDHGSLSFVGGKIQASANLQ
jgi:asparagine synthase (glutamine-hydrolysing)